MSPKEEMAEEYAKALSNPVSRSVAYSAVIWALTKARELASAGVEDHLCVHGVFTECSYCAGLRHSDPGAAADAFAADFPDWIPGAQQFPGTIREQRLAGYIAGRASLNTQLTTATQKLAEAEKERDRWRSLCKMIQGWMEAAIPEMECREDEDCDHCLGAQIMADYGAALASLPTREVQQGNGGTET